MGTLANMRDEIQEELGETTGVLSDTRVENEIVRQIGRFRNERFWFNETATTGTVTVADQAAYDLPADLLDIDEVEITYNSFDYQLEQRSWHWYRSVQFDQTSRTGPPHAYALYNEQIYFYPTPDAVFPYTIWYIRELPTLTTNDQDEWTSEEIGYNLIKAAAKQNLLVNVIRSYRPGELEGLEQIVQTELRRLRRKTAMYVTARETVVPTQW